MAEALITADECRIALATLGWSEADMAAAAGVAVGAILDLQTGKPVAAVVSGQILSALDAVGISFFAGPDGRSRMRARTLDGIIESPVTMMARR